MLKNIHNKNSCMIRYYHLVIIELATKDLNVNA